MHRAITPILWFLTNLYDRLLVALRLRRARPPILYVDRAGIGWCKPPEWLTAEWPDEGQHDAWKMDMRVFLWRAAHGLDPAPRVLDMRPLRISHHFEQVPRLWPVGQQLAEVSRRLGFQSLAKAAMPELHEDALRGIYDRHEQEAIVEARLMLDRNKTTAASWDAKRMGGPFTYETEEQTIGRFTLGPFEGAAAQLNPLPLRLSDPPDTRQYARRVR